MKKIKNYIFFLVLIMLVCTIPLQAAGLKKIAQSGMQWLSIPVGARAAALGGAWLLPPGAQPSSHGKTGPP